jgi:CRP-like cAMP-binding protein
MIEAHLLRLRARDRVGDAEEAAMRAALTDVRDYPARKTIVHAGQDMHYSTLILSGLICRYKDLSDGQRQITAIHVPGDFADLHSFTLVHLDHGIMTLAPTRVAIMPHHALTAITEQFPHLARLYWFSTNVDASIHREWALSLGRRSALGRCAHLLCELRARLAIVGLVDAGGYALPMSQVDFSECLGLTPVHVNRSLRRLREMGLVTFRQGQVAIHDLAGLEEVAEFDPAYLYLSSRPV